MLSKLLISSCSPTNFAVMSNTCFKVRFPFSPPFFPSSLLQCIAHERWRFENLLTHHKRQNRVFFFKKKNTATFVVDADELWCQALVGVHGLMFQRFLSWRFPHVTSKTLRKSVRHLHGLHFLRVCSKAHHHQPLPPNNGPQNWFTKKKATTKPPRGHLRPNQECETSSKLHYFFGTRRLKKIRPFIPKTQHDTSCVGLWPYYLLAPRPQTAVTLYGL